MTKDACPELGSKTHNQPAPPQMSWIPRAAHARLVALIKVAAMARVASTEQKPADKTAKRLAADPRGRRRVVQWASPHSTKLISLARTVWAIALDRTRALSQSVHACSWWWVVDTRQWHNDIVDRRHWCIRRNPSCDDSHVNSTICNPDAVLPCPDFDTPTSHPTTPHSHQHCQPCFSGRVDVWPFEFLWHSH